MKPIQQLIESMSPHEAQAIREENHFFLNVLELCYALNEVEEEEADEYGFGGDWWK